MSNVPQIIRSEIGYYEDETIEIARGLDPLGIWNSVHKNLQRKHANDPKAFTETIKHLVEEYPIVSYIYHMDLSRHSLGFVDLMNELIYRKGVKLRAPFVDIGSGPGNMTWWYYTKQMLPPGDVALIDVNRDYLRYAVSMLVGWPDSLGRKLYPVLRNRFHFWHADAEELPREAAEAGLKFNSAHSSLVLQWVGENMDSKKQVRAYIQRICNSIFESLNPGGVFILIGETPTNVTAKTPISLEQAGGDYDDADIGYNKGVDLNIIIDACIEVGFEYLTHAEHQMGMLDNPQEVAKIRRRFRKQVKQLIKQNGKIKSFEHPLIRDHYILDSIHKAYAIALKRPE